jgi:ABC-type nitrate/sulfonate/bicarbonate transport system permease component
MNATSARSRAILGIAGAATSLAVWELLPRVGVVNPEYFPPFSVVVQTLVNRAVGEPFWVALGQTLVTWLTGLGIATAASLLIGLLIGGSQRARRLTSSTIEFLRPIPSVALIPLAVLMFGTKMSSTLLLVVYASLWQVLLQVLYGVVDVDPQQRDMGRSYRFRRRTVLGRIVLPTVLPYAFTGFRLAASVALVLTITGELIIGTPGLGQQIAQARTAGATTVMYAFVLMAGLLGVCINLATRTLERRVLQWHPSVRVAAT